MVMTALMACSDDPLFNDNRPYVGTYDVETLREAWFEGDSVLYDSLFQINEIMKFQMEDESEPDKSVFDPVVYEFNTRRFFPLEYLINNGCQGFTSANETFLFWDVDVANARLLFWGNNNSGQRLVQVSTIMENTSDRLILFHVQDKGSGSRIEQTLTLKK